MKFIKFLFVPQEMKRFRFMSVFIAIGIFVLSVYALRLPFQVTSKNSKPELIASDVLRVAAFDGLVDETFDFTPIKNSQYRVVNGSLSCNFEDENMYRLYTASYTKEGRLIVISFVFDPHNNIEEQIEALRSEYKTLYSIGDDADTATLDQVSMIAMLAYVERVENPALDVPAFFATKHALTNETLSEEANAISRFSYFGINPVSTQDDYLLIFTEKFIEYQIPLFDAELKPQTPQETLATVNYTSFMNFDVGTMNSISDFSQKFASNILDIYLEYSTVQYTLQAVLMVVFYPVLVALILWLFFRKNGFLKTFKEYYNIAALASVIPTLVTFGVLWFFPSLITIYGLVLSVFYIFILYRINLSPVKTEEATPVSNPKQISE
jgi:maltodextrin utilization protein YvdJ